MNTLQTYGYHDQFSFQGENKESLSVVRNNRTSLLIDCPAHAVRSLVNDTQAIAKSTLTKIDHILITHIDSDHIGGIAQLLWCKKFGEGEKLSLITHPHIRDDLWKTLEPAFGKDRTTPELQDMNLEDYIDFTPIEYGGQIDISGFGSIKAFERSTEHCVGMDVIAPKIFGTEGEILGSFSADTKIDTDLLEFLQEGNAPIIHEVGAYVLGSHSHTYIDELIEALPEKAQQRTYINHIPERLEEKIAEIILEQTSPLRFASALNT